MGNVIDELDSLMQTEGRLFPTRFGFAVLDPETAISVNLENFRGLPLRRPMLELIGREEKSPLLWQEVRAILLARMKTLTGPDALGRIYDQTKAIAAASGSEVDLTWKAEHIIARPLIPLILDGFSGSELRRIERDQDDKIRGVLYEPSKRKVDELKDLWVQLQASLAVRRALARRLSRGAAPREDLTQALLPLAKRLGRTRLVYIVTILLTAVAGVPGTVAARGLFELMRRPEWRGRIAEELSAIPIEDFLRGPVRSAPLTHRFVKEVLRLWTFPVVARRNAYRDLEVNGCPVARGDFYLLSPYFSHRDPAHWSNPEVFDPDRWLGPESDPPPGVYVPFGWTPMMCIGASLGLAQLMLLCRLATVDFSIEITSPGRLASNSNDGPVDFRGIIRRRDGAAAESGLATPLDEAAGRSAAE